MCGHDTDIARGRARKQKVELVADLKPLPGVTCSPARINQVILNLVMNAIDACNEGNTVTVRTRPSGGSMTIDARRWRGVPDSRRPVGHE